MVFFTNSIRVVSELCCDLCSEVVRVCSHMHVDHLNCTALLHKTYVQLNNLIKFGCLFD